MFTLLAPTALLALTGMLVPVAIHLWNRRPGREVAVGSLRWLAAGANRRLRNLKPEQLWLLLLRAALLAVLAVAVAGPMWRTVLPASRGVVLLSPEVLSKPAFATLRPGIDSLQRRGYALRWLAAGFPRILGERWRATAMAQTDTAQALIETDPAAKRWLWARVRQATATFAGQPLYVVTPAALPGFAGSHNPLPAKLTWHTLPDTTTSSWLAAAEQAGDSLQLLVGRSNETQTTFRRKNINKQHDASEIRLAGLAPLRFRLNKSGGKDLVLVPASLPAESAEGVSIEVVPMVIEIYATPTYAADARYLEAALRAAATGMALRPRLRRVKTPPANLGRGWTFWLSDEPLPPLWQQQVREGAHLWRVAAGPGVADTAQLATTQTWAAAPVTMFRRGTGVSPGSDLPLWADGQGRAVLARHTVGTGGLYQLHTRLNPTWSTLADDPQLPARLLRLLQPELNDAIETAPSRLAQAEAAHDRRALDPAQLPAGRPTAPPLRGTQRPSAAPAFRITDLRPWLVLLAGLLLLLERLLARRRESSQSVIHSI